MKTNDFLPVVTLIAGALLGLLSSLLITRLQQRNNITIKVVEKFFEVREALCDRLSTLASLDTGGSLDDFSLPELREEISRLFYRHYDFLPSEVLKELLCLYACLSDKRNRLYKIENDCLIPLEDSDLPAFAERISLVRNSQYWMMIPLKSKDENLRRVHSIRYQARSVLISINEHFTIQDFMSWVRHLPKKDPR